MRRSSESETLRTPDVYHGLGIDAGRLRVYDPAVVRDAVLGIGSNLGDREARIARAIAAVGELPRTSVLAVSTIRETAPVGPPQGAYLNAAVRIATSLAPLELLDALLAIERDEGRVRREKWGPRTLDLDVLWIRDTSLDDARLVVPHPHLRERVFALEPLVEVAPDAKDPRDGASYVDVLAELRHA